MDNSGKVTTVFAFPGGGANGGSTQLGVALIRGVLYGGALGGSQPGANSILFSINTDGSGYTVLNDLTTATGGYLAGLMQPSPAGGEFGLGRSGGSQGDGTLFYLGATNVLSVAHDFAGGTDGKQPTYLIEDANHNLFGSNGEGGVCPGSTGETSVKDGCGTIFEYVPKTRTYTVLYSFRNGMDGHFPLLGAVGPDGTLYGVTTYGSTDGFGALFALTPGATGYTLSVLSPVLSKYQDDMTENPPTLSPSGALVGATGYGSYVYQNGEYSIHYLYPSTSTGQYAIPAGHPDAFLGTTVQGGIVGGTCPEVNGCGFIYYGSQ